MSDRGSINLVQVMETVKLLSSQIEDSAQANRDLADEFSARRSEARWIALAILVVITIITVGAWIFRVTDNRREHERREHLAQQIFTQREGQVQGCERGNEQRRTLAEVISRSVQPSTAPITSTDPELRALLEQARERTIALRKELLSLPGVQAIDCQAAYPLPREIP
jgi:type VI protein secretion system component VasK